MPKKIDHRNACAELAKLPPEALQAITVRLPAGLLVKVHRFAEEKSLDLATAIRELTTLGLEAASRPGALTPAQRKGVKEWEERVKHALRAGKSPFEPFLDRDHEDVEMLAVILASLDYQSLYARVKRKRQEGDHPAERTWKRLIEEAQTHVKPLMASLDKLEKRFLARKKWYFMESDEGQILFIRWSMSDELMKLLANPASEDTDIEAVRQLIAARYLVAKNWDRLWEFEWDE